MKDPNNKELNTDSIAIDSGGGNIFEGNRSQFADCFFSNASDDEITSWCKQNWFSLSINGIKILRAGGAPIVTDSILNEMAKEELDLYEKELGNAGLGDIKYTDYERQIAMMYFVRGYKRAPKI